ncbi:alpha/beta hydrolase [Flammeovirga sp. SubArs3]|uniref:alpha/beta fold hydrolase n=1 Tax=Flammeovirga sp. SubArs3 TaxID=2995316 RepID=UPI00248CDD4C|nr:alpha/beta hydrolase [Flammeovirga sp. SubArs3]
MEKEWKNLEKKYLKDGVPMKVYHAALDTMEVNYLSVNALDTTSHLTFIFIHGAPGSANDFGKFLKNDSIRHLGSVLSVERLGYGSEKGHEIDDISLHAKSIHAVMDDWDKIKGKSQSYILVGHSYGGPIAAYASIGEEKRVNHIALLAPAMSAELEPMKWYSRWAQSKVIYSILPSSFKVATDEKAHHAAALKTIENDWSQIEVPTTIVHGKKDGLVPFANMEFVEEKWKAPLETQVLEKKGHIFPFTDPEIVVDLLIRLGNRTEL